MNQQKGFSLIEVLTSLLLASTLLLFLLQEQLQGQFFLNQLSSTRQGTQFLDHVEETLLVQVGNLPPIKSPYHGESFNPCSALKHREALSSLYSVSCR